MDLVIDAGNTRIKLGYFEKDKLSSLEYIDSASISNIYKLLSSKNFNKCILGSVVIIPQHLSSYLKTKSKYFLSFGVDTNLPIKVRYAKTRGSDRIAMAVGAYALHPGKNILAIGMGTCITYNFISAKAIYSGGAISPGLQMRFKTMHENTALLPLVHTGKEDSIPLTGKNTNDSILSGVVNGLVYEVEGFLKAYQEKYNDLHCIISGGDSRYISEKLPSKPELQPELGLQGLYEILKFNTQKFA